MIKTAPTCPEHGCEMRYEAQPNWWRGRCNCQVRVFEEDRRAYVPATTTSHRKVLGLHGRRITLPLRDYATTVWLPLNA